MSMATELGPELTLNGIYPAFEIISNNNDQIKTALIDQFLPLAQFTTQTQGDIGYLHTTAHILPRLNDFMYDKSQDVWDKAIQSLLNFCDYLSP